MGDSDETFYLIPERELSSTADDDFDHEAHIETLEDIIKHCETPWHIGLYGTWGSGKTTIVDLLYRRLRASQQETQNHYPNPETSYDSVEPRHDHRDVIAVSLDAWKHAEGSVRTELLLDLNRSIAEQLDARFPDADLAEPDEQDTSDSSELARTHTSKGVFGTTKLIERLYDIERDEQQYARGITETIRRLNPWTWGVLGIAVVFRILVDIAADGTLLGADILPETVLSALPLLTSIANIVLGLVVFTVLVNLVSDDWSQARTRVEETAINPYKDWSGAYENLFRSILSEAEEIYSEETAEQNGSATDLTFVITIDDLDRCENTVAYETLIALKSFLAVENCIYIIPCDKQALLHHLESVDESAYLRDPVNQQDFLAKLIDTELEVAEPVPAQLRSYFEEQIGLQNHEFSDRTLQILRTAEFTTPRRITRVLNRLVVLTELATNRQDTSLTTDQSPTRRWRTSTDGKSRTDVPADSSPTPDQREETEPSSGDVEDGNEQDMLPDEPEQSSPNGGTSPMEWNMPFLAITAVLQEAYPRFYTAMVKDPYRLTEIYQQLQPRTNAPARSVADIFGDLPVATDRRQSLLSFLSATAETGRQELNPEPYLRLGQSPLTNLRTFERRLRDGRTDALRLLLQRESTEAQSNRQTTSTTDAGGMSGAGSYLDVIQRQLLEEGANDGALESIILVFEHFSTQQEEIAATVLEALEQRSTGRDLFGTLSPSTIRPIFEGFGGESEQITFLQQYIRSMVGPDGVAQDELQTLAEDFGDQLLNEEIQQAFETALIAAHQDGDLSGSEYRRAVDTVRTACPDLYTPHMAANR